MSKAARFSNKLIYVTVRISATLTIPAAFTPKTIHGPGIAIPMPGTVTEAVVPLQAVEKGPQSSRRRWSVLELCVAPPMRIMDTIERASDAVTVMMPPGAAKMLSAFSFQERDVVCMCTVLEVEFFTICSTSFC